jgi:outer membrane receptor for ferrienterochelin and colicins
MLQLNKILLLTWVLFYYSTSFVFGQQSTIQFLNAVTNEPVVDVHIVIKPSEEKNTVTIKLISNAEGKIFTDFIGEATLSVSHTSFIPFSKKIFIESNSEIKLEPVTIKIDDVIVTASFTPTESKRSLYPVTVIKEESIERRGANNLKDVLKQQLNVRVSQDAILGSGIALQGLGGQQVKILVDGVPVIGRINGNVDISQLNLNDAEKIEIIEGPVSMQYGTNALGGVVNIISKQSDKNRLSTQLNTYYESVGQYNIDGSIAYSKKKNSLRVSFGRYFFDGFSPTDTTRNMLWDPKQQYFGNIKYGLKLKEVQFTYSGNIFHEIIENRGPKRPLLYITAFDDYYTTLRVDNSISAKGKIFKNHYLDKVVAYNFFQRRKDTYLKDLTTLEKNLTSNTEDQDTARFTNILVRGVVSRDKPDTWMNYQLGYDINHEMGTGRRIENNKQSIGDYAMFFNFNLRPIEMLVLQPGARWSYNTTYKAPISPVMNVKLQPVAQLIIRTSYSRGFRAPDLKELYFEFVDINHNILGNPNLKAETSHNFNFNLQFADTYKQKHFLKIQPAYFYTNVNNNIFLVITNFIENRATNINIGKYKTTGVQLQTQYTFNNNLNVLAGVSYTGRSFDYDTTSTNFYYSPEVSAEISYTIPKTEVTLSVFNKWNGELVTLSLQENQVVQQQLAAFNTLDISANRSFLKNKINITIGGKNMLNVTNVAARGFAAGFHGGSVNSAMAGWGRSVFVSLKFNFVKNA